MVVSRSELSLSHVLISSCGRLIYLCVFFRYYRTIVWHLTNKNANEGGEKILPDDYGIVRMNWSGERSVTSMQSYSEQEREGAHMLKHLL